MDVCERGKTWNCFENSLWWFIPNVEYGTVEKVDWFHHRRLFAYCGDIPPVKAEVLYYARNQAQKQLEPSNQ